MASEQLEHRGTDMSETARRYQIYETRFHADDITEDFDPGPPDLIVECDHIRDAVEEVYDGLHSVTSIETSDSHPSSGNYWLTVDGGMDLNGIWKSRTLHWPKNTSKASAARIVRAVKQG